jgi:hypothetical protein
MARAGLGLWLLLAIFLAAGASTGILDALLLSFLLVGLPALSLAQLPLLKDAVVERVPAYVSSAVAIVVVGLLSLAVGGTRFGTRSMGLHPLPLLDIVIWVALALLSAGVLLACFWGMGRTLGLEESPILRELLPQSGRERRVFVLLSICAGLGEELAYRAYAVLALEAIVGSAWAALAIACVPFGLVHVYQGRIGVVRTYLLGLVLGASFLATGSLWPAVIAHALIDVVGGLFLGERLLGPRPEPALGGTG